MSDKKYHLGLCMAGAVSAGAYTAGVIDYLIETLDKWEKARGTDESIPTHEVVLDVMGGASAGGMTSIITAIALQQRFSPIHANATDDERNLNPFFNSWVNLTGKDMMQQMLNNTDLADKDKPARSLFNSMFIDKIANEQVHAFSPGNSQRRYVNPELEVFVTLSNLVGIPYKFAFKSNTGYGSSFNMTSYRDFGHFRFNAETYRKDGRINISGKDGIELNILRQCAMATGAFPFGLTYREVQRDLQYLIDNKSLRPFFGKGNPDWEKLASLLHKAPVYDTVNVDGGLMNNEPFEVTMHLLLEHANGSLNEISKYASTNASVIMIDPFPTEDDEVDFEKNFGLGGLLGKLYTTVRGQLLFKEEDIERALDERDASRYMIVPKRKLPNGITGDGSKAIACGAFGGFSGFFDYSFRAHDYQLGRYNCQKFLRDNFTIRNPQNNPIFAEGYSNSNAWERYARKDSSGDMHVPIIPDVDFDLRNIGLSKFEKLQSWPRVSERVITDLKGEFRNRYKKIIYASAKFSPVNRLLFAIGYRVLIGRMLATKTTDLIVKNLREHQLLK